MTPGQQNTLQQKKQQLQLQIQFKAFLESFITPFIAILENFSEHKINHRVVLARCIPQEFKALLSVEFTTNKFEKYKLSKIKISTEDAEIEHLLESFPNTHPLRYVPDLPIVEQENDRPTTILKSIINSAGLPKQQVYVCYMNFGFLLKVDLHDLSEKATDDLFNIWLGDAVVFPKNQEWLIAYSLENEWRFGRKEKKQKLNQKI